MPCPSCQQLTRPLSSGIIKYSKAIEKSDDLELVRIYSADERVETINRIYTESFPVQERFGMDIIMRLADEGVLEVFAIMQSGVTAGILITIVDDVSAYIAYFAIDKAFRGQGLGSEVLSGICSTYSGRQVVLEIELMDKNAPNYEQRIRREKFYTQRGFSHTGRFIRYSGVTYEIMFAGKQRFDKVAFDRLMDSRRDKEFQPLLFDAGHYSTYIFDLDGTLLDTLDDLTASTNHAIASVGCAPHSREEICSYVGNGIEKLIRRALPEDVTQEVFEKAFAEFKAHYKLHCNDRTKAYSGIMELLSTLKAHGKKVAVVSNKADFAVKELCGEYFGGLADICVGEREGVRKKPAPDSVLTVMDELGSQPKDCLYIGDSDVDIATAANAGINCISVLWGFRSEGFLRQSGAAALAQSPNEIAVFTLCEDNDS